MSKFKTAELLKVKKIDEIFGDSPEMNISIKELKPFKNHPFRVVDDEKMDEMVESIKKYGVITPIIVRKDKKAGYELISGHRRTRACELAGINEIPALVKELSDDEAAILMVDANIQRETLLPSEKAKSYRIKYEAEKHQGKKGGASLDEIAEQTGEGVKTVQRYLWLSRLSDGLLEMVDTKKLDFCQGVDISFLTAEEQAMVELAIKMGEIKVSVKQSALLKEMSKNGQLNMKAVESILAKETKATRKFAMNERKIAQYFDNRYTNDDIEEIIMGLLEAWKKGEQHGNSEK